MTVMIAQADGVMTLTLSRLDKKNALSAQMYQQLSQALQQASADPQCRVVLLTGGPDCFCAGNDLADFLAGGSLNHEHPTVQFLHVLSQFDKPLIAAVAGLAIGIGTTALLHCDLVYATADARFQMPFTSLGLCPEAASSLLLPKLVGYQRAAQYLLLGEAFDGGQAHQMGLVNEVVAAADLLALARQKARQLAALPAAAVQQSKRLLKQPLQQQIQHVLHQELAEFEQLLHSEECKTALKRFFQR
ncbi:enoyl-CoA hydratase-related protein [Rheinheimera texasensis]|jgi:enoyl-CoA hydratase/carnithine racemase|uniref:enoyl-CoA hydratase-related protein n=1 Tax=Rheinheimera texasensis TaxID=306205 RepID=UPI0004E2694E|nr:enoyl-CoA hydratase-related protein [Rheinheimera texasensis]